MRPIPTAAYRERPRCDACDTPALIEHKHDAFYCPNCNRWLEEACKDATCDFCAQRPETPR